MGCGQSNEVDVSAQKYRSHKRKMKCVRHGEEADSGSMVAEVTSQASHIPDDDDDDWISLMGSEYEADQLIEQCRERKRKTKQRQQNQAGAKSPKNDADADSNEDKVGKSAADALLDEERTGLGIVRWVDVVLASSFATYLLDEHSRKQCMRKAKDGGSNGPPTANISLIDNPTPMESSQIMEETSFSKEETLPPGTVVFSPPAVMLTNGGLLSPGTLSRNPSEKRLSVGTEPSLIAYGSEIALGSTRSNNWDGASSQLMSQSLLNDGVNEPGLTTVSRDQHLLVLGACKAVAVCKLGLMTLLVKKRELAEKDTMSSQNLPANGLQSAFYEEAVEKLPPTVQQTRDPFDLLMAENAEKPGIQADSMLTSPNSQLPEGAGGGTSFAQGQRKSFDQATTPRSPGGEEGASEYLASSHPSHPEDTSDSASWTEGKNDDILLGAIAQATGVRVNPTDAGPKRRSALDDDGEHLLTTQGLARWEQEVDRAVVRCIVERKGLPTASVDASELEDAGVEDYQIFRSIYTIHNPTLLKSPCCQCPHPLGTPDGVTQWLHLILFSVALASPEPGASYSFAVTPQREQQVGGIDVASGVSRASMMSHASQTHSVHKHASSGRLMMKNPKSVPELQMYLLRIPPLEKASFFARATYQQVGVKW